MLLLTAQRSRRWAAALIVLLLAAGCGPAAPSRDGTGATTAAGAPGATTAASSTMLRPATTTATSRPTATVTNTASPAPPVTCTRAAAESLVGEFFAALASDAAGLTDRFFNPEEWFFLYLDPTRGEGAMHQREGLEEHFHELRSAGVALELLAVDSYEYEPQNPEGREVGTVLFWLHRLGEPGPGAGKASLDCATGLFERFAISIWALPDDGGQPAEACSRAAGEAALAAFFAELAGGGDSDLARRFFNPPETFAGYRDPFGFVARGDVAGLGEHLGALQAGAAPPSLFEVTDEFAFTWSEADRLVNLMRFQLLAEDGAVAGTGRASVDCETGSFLHMAIDDWNS